MFVDTIVMSSLSFLILIICIFSLFFLAWLEVFSFLPVFSKNQLLILLIFCIDFLFFEACVLIMDVSLTDMDLRGLEAKSLPFFESQFPHLQNGCDESNALPRVSLREDVKCKSTLLIL